jgi:steroid delta-isomerase-like uncharacterized protein
MGDSPDLKALLRRITDEIWNEGRLELIDELVAEDFVDHVDMPGLELVGRPRYRHSVEIMRTAFPDYHEHIEWCVAEGEIVADYVTLTGTHLGDFHGMAATGRRVEMHSFGALRIRDGKAVERWGIGDTPTLLGQLGAPG